MTTSRRRILRPERIQPDAARREQQGQQRRDQIEKERSALARWMTRLKRAFTEVDKRQRKIAYLEKQLSRLQQIG